MKTILLLIIGSICFDICNTRAEQQQEKVKTKAKSISYSGIDTIDYKTQVLPILQKKCSPCHFTGGKMYERMPFDNSQTIIGHEAGVLKRFKDEQENTLIKQFIAQNKMVH
jgi:hypothetical protein